MALRFHIPADKIEKILKKLDAEMSQTDRADYIIKHLQDSAMNPIMHAAALKWKKQLKNQQMEIEKLNKLIEMNQLNIKNLQEDRWTMTRDKAIEAGEKAIATYTTQLATLKAQYETSKERSDLSIKLGGTYFEAIQPDANLSEQETSSPLHRP